MISRRILQRAEFRFELRPYTDDSVEALVEAALESRGHVAPWMAWLKDDYGRDDARTWVAQAMESWERDAAYEFLIFDRQSGGLAGSAGLNAIDRKDQVCNLGYWVRASKLRLGAACQATELLAAFGFDVLSLNRLEIVVAVGNAPSQRVAERAGAVCEGVQGQRITVGEAIHDAKMYALLRGNCRPG
jgi:RimJ/RimL family protein N-acetyltransferase